MLEHCNTQPQNEQCEGASIRGLSFTNKVNEFENEPFNPRLLNRATGEVLEITPEIKHKFRLSRMQRRVYAWANAMKSIGGLKGGFRYRQVMITLTYAPDVKWSPNQIKDFMSGLKRVLGDNLLAYAWVAEMQERGVPHYHVFCVVKKGTKIPMPDKPYGQRGHVLWPYGMTKIETAKTPYYLVKYTGKEHQKEGFYKGMRIFAVWIAKGLLSELERRIFRVSGLPKWLASEVLMFIEDKGYKHPKPAIGGGWEFMGQVLRSDWEYQEWVNGAWVNASSSMANLQYDDMTDGERRIIDYRELVDFARDLAGL